MSAKTYLVRFGSDNPSNYTGLTPTFTKFFNSAGNATTAPSISELASSGLYSFSYEPTGFIGFVMDGTASIATSTSRYVAGVLDPNDRISEVGASITALGASLIAQGATISVIGSSLATMGSSLSVMGGSLSVMGGSLTALGTSSAAMGVSIAAMGATLTGIGAFGPSLAALSASFAAGASLIGSAADSFGTNSVDPTTLFGFMKRIQELQEGDSIYVKGTGVWTMYNRGSTTALRAKTVADSGTQVTKV